MAPDVPRAAPVGTGNGSQNDQLGRRVDQQQHSLNPEDGQALPLTVAEWPRNARETVRVRLDRYNGRDTIDIRSWWTDAGGELKPGRSGFTLSVRHLPKLAEAFNEALRRARELGLVDDEGGRR
jgi:hypothetical protein